MKLNPLISAQNMPPVARAASWRQNYDGAAGPLIDLSQAVPSFPPHPALGKALAEAAASIDAAGYGAVAGDTNMRQAYATWVNKRYNLNSKEKQTGSDRSCTATPAPIDHENTLLTAGCNQAFMITVMTLAQAGDTALLLRPTYFNHDTTLQLLGINVDYLDCHMEEGFLPDPSALARRLADTRQPPIRLLALATPNNPTGAAFDAERLDAIADLTSQHGVWLILDETYRDYLPDTSAPPHGLFSRPDWRKHIIGLYSFSKSFCIPGHRLGAMIADADLIKHACKVMDNMQICAPRPPQQALRHLLEPLESWRNENRDRISDRATKLQAILASLPSWQLGSIGAYFAFVRIPQQAPDAEQFAEQLALEHGVVTMAGSCFGSGLDRYLRLAFANVDETLLDQLEERLKHL